MKQTKDILGFSISPTHIGAVRVSASDFSLQYHTVQLLPPSTLSHDGKRLMDADALVVTLRDMVDALGHPEFSNPVCLSIYSPWFGVYEGELSDKQPLQQQILTHVLGKQAAKEPTWMLKESLLWQHGTQVAVAYTILDRTLIENLCDAFYQAGLQVTAVDLIPFTILRTMATSGVLDALLKKIGEDAYWGCFGVCGSQTWLTVWHGTTLQHMDCFTTPADQSDWESQINRSLDKVQLPQKLKIWLAWQETGMQLPINPLKLELGAPVRETMLGPIYQKRGEKPSLAALGSALKTEVPFPMGWDFLADADLEPVKADYAMVPYNNYQPLLPRLFLAAAIMLFVLCVAGTMFFKIQNARSGQGQATFAQRLDTAMADIASANITRTNVLAWLENNAMTVADIDKILLGEDQMLTLTGAVQNPTQMQKLTVALSPSDPNLPFVRDLKHSEMPMGQGNRFTLSGHLYASLPREHQTP